MNRPLGATTSNPAADSQRIRKGLQMSDALIVGLITAFVSLVGIFVSAKLTRDGVTHKLDTNQQLIQNEISHIKVDIGTMKEDIKSHNNYAKLFKENIPLLKEKLSVSNKRISDIEDDIRFYHRHTEE
jgi:peptidoglycan hydrolase CwlO-like protein